jgi:amino acid adenylation domain-containing protein/non-ribosomal peptide synthase protein (TIGR01720 family)
VTSTGDDRSLALMKRALEEIRDLRAQLQRHERAAHEPIAIVGMGCRFPAGIADPESLWRFFLDGGDAIQDVPVNRPYLQSAEGRPRFGSFLDDVDRFDAPFFEISAREARSMDPQQRLLLEVSWETLERAGVRPSALRGSRTGVYVGVMTAEYEELTRGEDAVDLHTATGNAPSVIAGRLSHFYGFQGPALVVDTACSSSLASVHLACQALRRGECDQALAGGVNLLLSPRAYEAESRAGMLAADGRCKTFDARADGIGRGEGAGLVFLRRLSDAVAAGDPIVAVIRGSAMNHDGRSSGLTTPNERAQERVLRDALADAVTAPRDVGFVEAHGTGTSLGDPVEVGALATVFGANRAGDRPLVVGAAKANFGHLEGAAGILALMKAALVVRHGEVPPQLHVERLNPLIAWADVPIRIPLERQPYPAGAGVRVAGVSSFGLSGTNVHAIVAQAPAAAPADRISSRGAHLLAFSARTPEALDEMDGRLRHAARSLDPESVDDLGYTVHITREPFDHRRAVMIVDGIDGPSFVASGTASHAPRVAFVFDGDAAEWRDAGERLLQNQPHFREAVARALGHLPRTFAGLDERVKRFVVRYAIAEMWRAWGVEPAGLVAHDAGAWVAACVAGTRTPQDAIQELTAGHHAAPPPVAGDHDVTIVCGPGGDDWRQILRSAAELYVNGAPLDRARMDAGVGCAYAPAPTYPFEDFRYWVAERTARPQAPTKTTLRLERRPVAIAGPHRVVFEGRLDASTVREHRVQGAVMLPAAAFVDLGLQIAQHLRGDGALSIRNLSIVRPLIVRDTDTDVTIQAVADTSGANAAWQIFRLEAEEWTLHAEGEIGAAPLVSLAAVPLSALKAEHQEAVDVSGFYAACAAHGLEYGPSFRSLAGLWRGPANVLGRIESAGPAGNHLAEPAALDGCLQLLGAAFPAAPGQAPLLPAGIESFSLARRLPSSFWCVATPRRSGAENLSVRRVDLDLLDDQGSILAVARGLTLRQPAAPVRPVVPLCEPTWQPLDDEAATAAPLAGTWVIFATDDPAGDALAARLRDEGAQCAIVRRTDIDPASEDDCAFVLDALPGPLRGVVHLWSTDRDRGDALVAGCASVWHLVKALTVRSRTPDFRLHIVTRGAQVVRPDEAAVDPWQAPVWGLARVALLEHPELGCRLLDLDAAGEDAVDALLASLRAGDGDEQVAERNGRRFGLRLAAVPAGHRPSAARVDADHAYLITGGLGALGLQVAGWLVSRGARHLTLVSRRPASPDALAAIDALRARGAAVHVVSGDVAIEADAVRAVSEASGEVPLGGVVHAAGVLDDRAIVRTTWESCERVFAPKIDGAWHLHQATRDLPLDFFVLFSSAASILGSPGQANYAAANAWMDALAHHRARLGLPAVSINWGPWAGAGMAATAASEYLTPLSPGPALDALEASMSSGRAQVAVLPLTARFHADFGSPATVPRLVAALARPRSVESVAVVMPPPAPGRRAGIDGASAGQRRALLADLLRRIVGDVLERPLPPDADVSLVHAGMDSLMALEIRDRVRDELDVTLPVVDILAAPSVSALAARLEESVAPARAAVSAADDRPETWPTTHGQRSLWFLHGLDPTSCAYHVAFVARVPSAIDLFALAESFNLLARRHPVLAAQFEFQDDELVCRTRPDRAVPFDVVDATGLTGAAFAARVQAEYSRPFDLAAGDAPFRAAVISRAADDHVLLTTAHHIVHDAWSVWLMAGELRDVYSALRSGRQPQLPPATQPFAAFAREEAQRLASAEAQRLWEFWRGELMEPLPLLELPTDHPRPARRTTAGATRTFELKPAETTTLRQFAAAEGVTLFTLLLAGFQALLHRYSTADDLIIGVPMSGRDAPGFERTVGYFVNPVPVRSRVTPETTFRDLVAAARGRVLAAMAHQGLPLPLIVDTLQLTHDPSRTPLFQALFVFQQPQQAPDFLDFEPYELHQQEGQFDLTLELVDSGERVAGSWKYSLDLFEPATAERMLSHLGNLLVEAVAHPDAPLGTLPLLSPAERETIVSTWNATGRPYELETTMTALLAEQVERTPDAIAVTFEETGLTYAELDAEAGRLAGALRARGVAPGGVVGVHAERSLELMVALCGILKAGCAFVPLDPAYPADRLTYMVETAGARAVVTQGRLANAVKAWGVAALPLDGPDAALWRARPPAAAATVLPDALAYVLFTSGSTGRPKGVMVSHRAIVNRLIWMQEAYRLGAADVVLQKTPASFDVSVWEFFWPLITGARLVMARPDGHRDPAYLADTIRDEGVTVLHFVPSMLAAFVEETSIDACSSLRDVVCSGEALSDTLCDRFFARSAAALHNLYGPTEAAVDVTAWRCARDWRGPVPIGRPIANIRMHVLDADGEPCPIGVPGELLIGGVGLARGYVGRPGLTSDRFVPDPLGISPGARLYRTGDRARYRADGALDYLGRLDFQVKLRGQRIELGEIERTLATHPSVRTAAVVLAGEGTPRARLIAHVEFHSPEAAVTEDALRDHLARRLPDVMIPSRIVAHETLPLTTSGKVDRRRLPEPPDAAAGRVGEPPRGATESTLAAIWAGMLERPAVGVHDNFFALGGDSILGMQMVMRAARAGIHVTVAQFYENQTVASLARVATAAHVTADDREQRDAWMPPAPIQAWFFEQPFQAPQHYNQSVLFDVAADVNADLLERAVGHLVAHHDSLRTAFTSSGENCVVPFAGSAILTRVDLTGIAAADRRHAIETHAAATQATLDLSLGSLFRATLYTPGDAVPGRLHLVAHHLAVDGVSWRILLDDLRVAYRQLERGETVDLPPAPASYRRWAGRLREYAGSDAARAELAFWLRQTLPDPDPLFATGEEKCAAVVTRVATLDAVSTAALLATSHDGRGTRAEDLLVTAVVQGLAELSARRQVLVDMESHGRQALFDDLDVTRTAGWFTALYPVLFDPGPDDDPRAALKSIRQRLRDVPRSGIGYGILRYLADEDTRSALAALPGPDVRFNYLGRLDQGLTGDFLLAIASEDGGPLHAPDERPCYAIEVDAYVLDGRLCMRWTHDDARVTADLARALSQRVLEHVRALVECCADSATSVLTPADVPAARLDQSRLDGFLARLAAKGVQPGHITDIYELSPLQEGMLYHWLTAATGTLYKQRMSVTFRGDLRIEDFRRAWQTVIDRHEALRTAFFYEETSKPLQVVFRHVELPWDEELDAPFDLNRAPLMRFQLLRLEDDVVRFSWAHHHILLDGWSFARLLSEVLSCYAGAGNSAAPGRYRDYIEWLQSRPAADGHRFWRGLLDGFTSPTELGIERAASGHESAAEHRDVTHTIDAPLTERIARLARDGHATVSVVLQAAWATLLHHYAGADDVVFGLTLAGRPAELPRVEETVGLFINTVPVRVGVSRRRAVRELLAELMAQQAAREPHAFCSLADIQAAAGFPAGTPLFGSLVVVENYPVNVNARSIHGVEISDFRFTEQTNYPLTLVAVPGERLHLKISYDVRRFQADAVSRMLAHLTQLLAGMAEGGDRPVGRLSLLAADERHRLLETFASGRAFEAIPGPAPSAATTTHGMYAGVHQLVEVWAALTPDVSAVAWSPDGGAIGESMSYRELDARSNRLSHRLRAMGVGRGDCVGVLMERGPDLIVALLGVLKAGAAYVPCDPAYPDSRVRFMIDDTKAAVAICDERFRQKLFGTAASLLVMDTAAASLETESDAPLSIPCGPSDPAYVIYTSGSTGQPKGVVVTHDNVTRLFRETDDWFAFTPADVWAFFHSVAFDFSVWEIWGALVHGARLVVVPFQVSRSADAFHRLLADGGVTVLSQTPSAFSQLMLVDESSHERLSLRYVVFGGEALDVRKLTPWFERHAEDAPRLVNMYGITETTVHVTYRPLTVADATRAESVIGVPIPDLRLYVLDHDLEPVPFGVPGELYVSGAGLASGYLGRPALTADRFVPDPFGAIPGGRLYRSGDRGRFLADGDAEHLGRLDAQVKLRGFRIELGEIEAALRAGDGVGDAVAVLTDLPGGPGLVGYVVPSRAASRPVDLDGLRASLHGRLPEYMIPSALIALDELPRTSNGKLDRRALPPPMSPATRAGDRAVPRTEAERRVLDIWREVLPVADIGIHDNFFDAGGHSLLLVRVHGRLKTAFDRDFPMVTLFAHPTVHTLAGFLGEPEDAVTMEAAAISGHDRGVERGARQDARSRQRAARERSRRGGVTPE